MLRRYLPNKPVRNSIYCKQSNMKSVDAKYVHRIKYVRQMCYNHKYKIEPLVSSGKSGCEAIMKYIEP